MSDTYTPRHARTPRTRTRQVLAWAVRHAPAIIRTVRAAWTFCQAVVDPAGGCS